jgi:arsenate reductase
MHPHRYNFPAIARVSGTKASNQEGRAMTIDFYHNPRCVTSRKAPSRAQLKKIAELIGIHPRDMLRKREKAELKKAGIDPGTASAAAAIDAMAAVPVLIERPIIVNGRKARLGRPPEKVLEAV